MKSKIVLIVVIFIFILFIGNFVNAANQEGVYDVILFWGQSNMQGAAGVKWTNFAETRIENEGIKNFSNMTGIREEILKNTTQVDCVNISQEAGSAYEYVYSNGLFSEEKGYLKEINRETKNIGQNLYYSPDTKLLHLYTGEQEYYSLQESHGTNMIPQFCNQYYKKTGRKVIVVMCARGGTTIRHFLPKDTNPKPYVYEAMVEKYKSAIKYLEDNGYNIGKKLYVACQGEADVAQATSQSNYESLFIQVHNHLKEDLGIERGAIVLTSREIGKDYEKIQNIHNAQTNLIKKNEDEIILGSEFLYNNYIPDSSTYGNSNYINKKYVDGKGNKLAYNEALKRARLSTCYKDDENQNNELHFTSAALSQVGYEVANAFSSVSKIEIVNKPKKTQYIIKYENLNLDGGKIRVTLGNGEVQEINMSNSGITISGFSNEIIGEKTITVSYEGKKTTFTVEIVKARLTGIEISEVPTKTRYIEGQSFNPGGMKVIAKYNDGTSKEITNYTVEDGDNLAEGKTSVTISYTEDEVTKKVAQQITVIEKTLTGIEISKASTKINYIEGQNFNPEGMKVIAKYNDGTSKEIANYTVEDGDNLSIGKTSVTISYTEDGITKTITQDIVVAAKSLVRIELKTTDLKQEYISKERLNTEGLVIIATYDNGTAEEIREGFECTPVELKEAGEQTIIVTYREKTATYTVQVTLRGDADGNNKIDFMDILLINKHRLGKKQLVGIKLRAADVTNDGKIDFMDILLINKYRLGKIGSL